MSRAADEGRPWVLGSGFGAVVRSGGSWSRAGDAVQRLSLREPRHSSTALGIVVALGDVLPAHTLTIERRHIMWSRTATAGTPITTSPAVEMRVMANTHSDTAPKNDANRIGFDGMR